MAEELIDFNLNQRLAKFFSRARQSLRHDIKDQPSCQINPVRFRVFVERLRAPLGGVRARAFTNPWQTAGLGNDEVRVSAVLAALWDRNRYGDEARTFLSRVFAHAGDQFPNEAELVGGYRVKTEHCLNGTIGDRVDITVETKSSIIGIEIKIFAEEGKDQLFRYASALESRARLMGRDKYEVIFLAPYSAKDVHEKVTCITWGAIAEAAAQADESTSSGWLVRQFGEYCRTLGI